MTNHQSRALDHLLTATERYAGPSRVVNITEHSVVTGSYVLVTSHDIRRECDWDAACTIDAAGHVNYLTDETVPHVGD